MTSLPPASGHNSAAQTNTLAPSQKATVRRRTAADKTRRSRRAADRLKQPQRRQPIPAKYFDQAKAKGFTLIERGRRSSNFKLRCSNCGQNSQMRRSVLISHQIQCNHCVWSKRFADAMACNATIIGTHPQSHKIAQLTLNCGHNVERQYGRVSSSAHGSHLLSCGACREERHAKDAIGSGWYLIGTTTPTKVNYRTYQHLCGHRQDHAIVNVDRRQVDCVACGETWASKPSSIYLFKIPLPNSTLLKFGHSSDPVRRLRYQLGDVARDHGSILHVINMPTGHAALKAEKKAHRYLRKHHPALVADTGRFLGQIKTKSEVYLPEAKDLILQLMSEISATVPKKTTLQKHQRTKNLKTKSAASLS